MEVEYVSPLLARPAVIPVRASTPVAALRPAPERRWRGGHGDGLGALRGTVAHRAIELSFGEGERPDLAALVRSESERLLDDELVARLVVEVSEMLDRFATLRPGATSSSRLPGTGRASPSTAPSISSTGTPRAGR